MKKLLTLVVGALALVLTVTAVPANAALKERSLATVLTSDGNRFDRNSRDFDITTEAVLAVLAAKPDSAVGVLAQGNTPLTAFVPTDQAFRRLLKDLTGRRVASEQRIFNQLVKALGVDTIEAVLLYHVVPGARVTRKAALKADGARLTTAAELPLRVRVEHRTVRLVDLDRNDANAKIVRFDINKGNRQIGHGIDRVLRPANLP